MESAHPLRMHRLARGWSLEEVAARLVSLGLREGARGLATSATTVGRWERGQCQPRHPYPGLLCILFEATPVELGIAPSPYLLSSDKLGDVERRRLLRLLGGALAAPVVARAVTGPSREAHADRLAHALSRPSKADEAAATAIEASLAHARRLDDVSGSRVAVGLALAQREAARMLLRDGPTGVVQTRLMVAAGELSQFLGFLAFGMNDSNTSLGYLAEALAIAHETDNHNLGAYVLGWRSVVEVAEGRHQQGMAFAEAARSWAAAKGSPATRSWLAGREADTLAELGDRKGAERALDRARTVLARSKPENEPPWMYYYNEPFLDCLVGSAYVTLGLAEPARRAMEQAIRASDVSMVRDSAWYLVRLGQTYVLDAEVDEACRLANKALIIATDTRCDRVVAYVRELRGQLEPWKSESTVRDLDDQLAAASTWCRQTTA